MAKTKSNKNRLSAIDPHIVELFLESLEVSKHDENLPSKIESRVWVFAKNNKTDYPSSTKRSGKWCIFVKKDVHDEWWKKIRSALRKGMLGDQIKTSTGINISKKPYKCKAVIIVYTYDYEDKEDVMRIRRALREIGVTWKIAYKSDKSTNERIYHKKGSKISIYYE